MRRQYRLLRPKDRNIQVVFEDFPCKKYSTGTRDELEAHQWAQQWLDRRGKSGQAPYFKDFAKDFFTRTDDSTAFKVRDQIRGVQRNFRYYSDHQSHTDHYLIPYFGNMKMNAITSVEIEDFLYTVRGKQGQELSSRYRLSILDSLSLIIRQACQLHILEHNPCSRDYLALPVRKPVREVRALSRYERDTLFPVCYKMEGGEKVVDVAETVDKRIEVWESLFFAAYFSVMLSTGFRPGEVRGIQCNDLYIVGSKTVVDISHSVPSNTTELIERVKTSNSGYKTRTGYIDPVAAELIKRLIKERCLRMDGPLFILQKDYVGVNTANLYLKATCKRMGLNEAAKLSQYCIRHTFGTVNKGNIPEAILAELMGHAGGHMLETYDNRDKMQRIAQVGAQSGNINKDTQSQLIQQFTDTLEA